jgi:hypothetical protein
MRWLDLARASGTTAYLNIRKVLSSQAEMQCKTGTVSEVRLMHNCCCSDTLRQEVSVTLLNVIKSTSIDRTPFDRGDLDTCQDTPVGFTQAGYPHLGNPDAPVTPEEYSAFLCPFCSRHFEQTVPTLVELYVQTGQAKYVFCDMPMVGLHPTAPIGHVAARCATVQGTAYFWAPPQEEEPQPPELPYWANADGLAPDLERPGFTLAGDPYKGNSETRLAVVEFTDSQCPLDWPVAPEARTPGKGECYRSNKAVDSSNVYKAASFSQISVCTREIY